MDLVLRSGHFFRAKVSLKDSVLYIAFSVYLIGDQLKKGGIVVSPVPDMLLRPHHVLHHHTEEEDEPQQMCPDVDRLVVEGQNAPDAAVVAEL